MHLLITGGAGYVGSHATATLLAAGLQVTVFDRLLYGGEALLPFLSHPRFRFVSGDVRDRDALRAAAVDVDGIVHLAAIVGEAACGTDDEAAWSINVEGTAAVLDVAARTDTARLLFISTCSNYGMAAATEIADETAPLRPLSRYAQAKVAAERLTLEHAISKRATVFRLGTICGLSARMRFDLLVSDMARAAVRGETIAIFAPDAWRPFLHVHDAARAILCWANAATDAVGGRVFNVVGENYRKRDLAALVRLHFPSADVTVTDRVPDARDYRVTAALIAQALNFTAERTVEDAFRETADAIAAGFFRDPMWHGHSAIPLDPAALRRVLLAAEAVR
jgi:nucleoside-diphosphate-sugar epimerase